MVDRVDRVDKGGRQLIAWGHCGKEAGLSARSQVTEVYDQTLLFFLISGKQNYAQYRVLS